MNGILDKPLSKIQKMFGKYTLLARDDQIDQKIDLEPYPELNVKYLRYQNNLCK